MPVSNELTAKEVWQNREDAIKRTGDMMLGGWRMLATHCPLCNSALLQKDIKVQCPSCNMPVMTEEQYDARTAGSVSPVTGNQVSEGVEVAVASGSHVSSPDHSSKHAYVEPVSTQLSLAERIASSRKLQESEPSYLSVDNFEGYYSDNDHVGVTNTLAEEKKMYDQNNKSRDIISGKLGEKMLSGWTLLGAVCPLPACYSTPLMSMKGQPVTCVGCDKKYKISDYDGNYEEIGEKKIVKFVENHIPPRGTKTVCEAEVKDTFDTESDYLPPLFDLTDAPILDFATPLGSDDPSLLISKKLIKGWALLDAVCDSSACKGSTPLMRDREEQVHCVVCGFLRDKHGKIVNIGGITTSIHKSPATLLLTHDAKEDEPAARRNTQRQRREVNDLEDDDDEDDDDEDAGHSVAYSAYVRSRIGDVGGGAVRPTASNQKKRSTNSAASTQQEGDEEAARPDAILDVLFGKMEATIALLSSSTDISQSILLADFVKSLAEAARSVKRLRECY